MPSMWVVRAGREAAHFEEFQQGGYVAIGWSEIGDVSPSASEEELKERLATAFPDVKPGSISAWTSQIRRFLSELSVGDDVVTYSQQDQSYLLGQILSAPEWRPALPLGRVRAVRWTHRVHRDVLSEATRNTLGAIQTLFRLNEHASQELRQKSQVIVSAEDRARIARDFWSACRDMLDAYPRRPAALSAEAEPVQIRRRIEANLNALAAVLVPNPHWRAAASVGQGNWVRQHGPPSTTRAKQPAHNKAHTPSFTS